MIAPLKSLMSEYRNVIGKMNLDSKNKKEKVTVLADFVALTLYLLL